jgi:4-alpha-glucanotransferase
LRRGPASRRSAGTGSRRASALRELASRMGIIDEYVDQTGKETRHTSDRTRVALLAAMGIEAGSEVAARRSIERLDAEERDALVAPTAVITLGDPSPGMRVRVGATARTVEWSYSVRDEHGHELVAEGRVPAANGFATIGYPPELPTGYYEVHLRVRSDSASREGQQRLIITPDRCPSPDTVLGGRRVFGLTANLYTLHGRESWGIGNLGDLGSLVEWAGEIGAAFVGLNPLHALFNHGSDVSPYSPVSRLFRNPLYLDISAIPELAESDAARELLASAEVRGVRADLRLSDKVQYERIAETLEPILRALHATFAERHAGGTERAERYRAYVAGQGDALQHFATFMALDRALAKSARGERQRVPWQEWPTRYQDPRSSAVWEFSESNADDIDFHRYLQFELDCQLAAAAGAARGTGMPIGLYQDLAIGTSPNGSDVWAFPDLFLQGVSIGAPPDPLAASGQNWGLPPIDPRRLAYDGYRYWIDLVRASLRHSGALRIDHVMGLFRQFWIPEGESGTMGAYVRFPSVDLLGILALEATRAGALVVGEDLGTVPPDVPPALEARNILSSKVLYFERTKNGGFKPANSYAPLSLATANTHDMPTLAGWWEGRDIELRNDAGQLGKKGKGEADGLVAKARDERDGERTALLRRLAADGVLPAVKAPRSNTELRAAVHSFLYRSSAALVGISIEDIVGERDPVNLPGISPDDFPSWTRRLRIPVETLRADTTIHEALGERRGRS